MRNQSRRRDAGAAQSAQPARRGRPARPLRAPGRIDAGARLEPFQLASITGRPIAIPDPRRLVHLQFRRFAGCPVCNLHLGTFRRRHREIEEAGICEIVVFHSQAADLQAHAGSMPFTLVADPRKRLYQQFGVEESRRAVLDPRSWPYIVLGVLRSIANIIGRREPVPPGSPEGGSFGLPADLLIAPDGTVLASHYGRHAYDQWSVDELIDLAHRATGEAQNS